MLINKRKSSRLKHLDQHHLLLSNNDYYDLKVQVDEIWARNNNKLEKSSEDAELVRSLEDRIKEIKDHILGKP